ncbi:MAG: tetratricopeptide repeat protein [Gammaproteobacteria bacterium]|nr:tetratricopeptide repeat protein [Gammaproteobacteria bacterium]MDH3374669.1 tetratricopeptide repeat protein [Gammaproteobacteria bacterium]
MSEQPADRAPDTAPPAKGSIAEFLEELRRRRVIRVALVYLVAAWAIIQVVEATFPALLLPDWAVTLVVVFVAVGFPIAIILAWAFQVESEHSGPAATSVRYVVDEHRKLDFVIITALALIVVILAYELYVREAPPEPQVAAESQETVATSISAKAPSRPSIGVLPFVNLSDDRQNEYFADGLAEEILNLLVRVREIDVASRTSSFYFKGKDVDIKTIAQNLGVSNVLEGSVRRQNNRIRVTAQLIEAASGFHIWSNTYDRELEDIFNIQDDIARQVVGSLEQMISSDSEAVLSRVPTDSLEAYQYYLQGRAYLRGEYTETQLQSARTLFDNAIRLDRDFADAYAGLCDTYLALYERSRSTEFFEQADRACHRGLTLDAAAGDVFTALGNLYRASGQLGKAATAFEQAISMNSRNVDAYFGLADTYKERSDNELAEITYQRAIEIQPGYWRGHLEMGHFLYYVGRVAEAIQFFAKVVNLAPDNATGHLNLGSSYYLLGDFENAARAWRKSIELKPSTSAYMNVGSSYYFLGRFDEAAEMYQKASELSPEDFEVWGSLGDAYRHTKNNTALAAAAYEKAIELGEKLLEINESDALIIASLAQYHAHYGNAERAAALIAAAEKLAPQHMYVQYFSAITHASLGNNDAAVAAIEKAVGLGYPADLLKPDAGLASIIDDRRVAALIEEDGA